MFFSKFQRCREKFQPSISTQYLDWQAYKARIDFLDLFYFQQRVRLENLKN
ncbi:hypothetical protein HYS48_00940 [Candidatus Woesearchaeota archaeon]|nr:hypothetical protein [Candidatus Woesearchaeota archaeon]